jgi:hypothetical protein
MLFSINELNIRIVFHAGRYLGADLKVLATIRIEARDTK